jgi:hypothetical protein
MRGKEKYVVSLKAHFQNPPIGITISVEGTKFNTSTSYQISTSIWVENLCNRTKFIHPKILHPCTFNHWDAFMTYCRQTHLGRRFYENLLIGGRADREGTRYVNTLVTERDKDQEVCRTRSLSLQLLSLK